MDDEEEGKGEGEWEEEEDKVEENIIIILTTQIKDSFEVKGRRGENRDRRGQETDRHTHTHQVYYSRRWWT